MITDNVYKPPRDSNSAHNTFDTLRPRKKGRRFADDTFKHIFLNENVRISIKV